METKKAVAFVALSMIASACGAEVTGDSDSAIPESYGVVRIGAEQHAVRDLQTDSSVGNAHDFYVANVGCPDGSVLTLSFAVSSEPGAAPFPVEVEENQVPADGTSQTIADVTGHFRPEGTTAQSLFGGVHGTLLVSGGPESPLFADVELTFPAAEFSREEHTESYPEIYVKLHSISFPSLY